MKEEEVVSEPVRSTAELESVTISMTTKGWLYAHLLLHQAKHPKTKGELLALRKVVSKGEDFIIRVVD